MSGSLAFPLRIGIWVLALALGEPLLVGCTQSSQATAPRGTEIVVFVDFSASVRKHGMALFEQDLENLIIPSLTAGDRFLIAPISDKTLTEFHPLVEAEFPPQPQFNGWMDNTLKYHRLAKDVDGQVIGLREKVRTQVSGILSKEYTSRYTDIFSSLLIAQKLFHNESRHKVLVLMSDMIEDYPPYRFEKVSWSSATNDKLLAELEQKGFIPDLSGVCVYISGVSAGSADLAENISRFWQAYFQRAKADMDPSRYAHVLLHWPPPKACHLT